MPNLKQTLLSALTLMVIGWGGLALMIFYFEIPPLVWARWAFFALSVMAFSGVALPIVYFFHLRFPSAPPAPPQVITRQALWVGVYGAMLEWLQLGRLVNLYVIFGLAVGFIAIESFMRLRENASPVPPHDDESA
ncbi:MAG: hypothetical protein Fur002_00150 [Anaerolineales bacterium]